MYTHRDASSGGGLVQRGADCTQPPIGDGVRGLLESVVVCFAPSVASDDDRAAATVIKSIKIINQSRTVSGLKT